MRKAWGRVAVAGLLLLAVGYDKAAQATPIVLEFKSQVINSLAPGIVVGDTADLRVFADNGGTGLASQSWDSTDIQFATMNIGSYAAATSGAITGTAAFGTDALGHLATLSVAIQQSGSDSNGNSIFNIDLLGTNNVWFGNNATLFLAAQAATVNTVTIAAVAATPLPAALPLLVSSLAGLGFACARRNRPRVSPAATAP